MELSPLTGPAAQAIALQSGQAARVRTIGGVTGSVTVDTRLFGHNLRLHLVGRKVDRGVWAGTCSPSVSSESVAIDLARGLSFAETILSEVNSLVVVLTRDGRIQRFNRVAEELAGLKEEDVIGKSAWDLFMSDEEAHASRKNIEAFFECGDPYQVERVVKTVKGPRLFLFRNKFVRTGAGEDEKFLVCSGADITEERHAQQRLARLANVDGLTGLGNRNYLLGKLHALLADSRIVGTLAILYVDLDNFKRVNDTLGHQDGDVLLKKVARRLQHLLESGQELTRISGDEFVILLQGAFAHYMASDLANRIIRDFELAYVLRSSNYRMRASIGIAEHVQHGTSSFDLLKQADLAMYAAKAEGKNRDVSVVRRFTPDLADKATQRLQVYQSLQYAFLRREICSRFDCFLSCDGRTRGLRASPQWARPDGTQIAGAQLIDLAESAGFGVQLGEFQLADASKRLRACKDEDLGIQYVSVTVPLSQVLDGDLAGCAFSCLREYRLDPGALRIVVPHGIDQASQSVLDKLAALRSTGVRVLAEISGHSAFPNLGTLPIDGLCITEDLTARLPGDPVTRAVITGIVNVCGEMSLDVLAYGVERPDQREWFKPFRHVDAQGNFLREEAHQSQ
ncbi:diguanylate cyclase [Paraburkholderia phymatum]|uniref:diguanylate cyclase domain-containing protein n=1 Tax=Paraburkholderia phymatum TaxID=148447 RepID=UPI00316BC67C